jgi:hypothetical protein
MSEEVISANIDLQCGGLVRRKFEPLEDGECILLEQLPSNIQLAHELDQKTCLRQSKFR